MKEEWLSRAVVVFLTLGIPAAVVWASVAGGRAAVRISGSMPETGGWQPEHITVMVGEPLRFELTSTDVVHGFAIGRDDDPPVNIMPGKVTELLISFDRPGTYTFYCTRWCGPNHWRMRGTIEVVGDGEAAGAVEPPPYLRLGIDIDAPHPTQSVPTREPSALVAMREVRTAGIAGWVGDSIRAMSPEAAWRSLRSKPILQTDSDDDVWDLVAWIWRHSTTTERLVLGRGLYRANCAACHGERGDGKGVLATQVAQSVTAAQELGHELAAPADFTAPQLLGASPVLLHGKILRGGMGTGMPYWGPILTDEQMWALVDYLWTFQFEYAEGF